MRIYVFDSLGMNPKKNSIGIAKDFLLKLFSSEFCSSIGALSIEIVGIEEERQADEVNCGIFVLHDLETSLELLQQNKPLFLEDKGKLQPDSTFFKITQIKINPSNKNVEELYLRSDFTYMDRRRNSFALFKAIQVFEHFLNQNVTFVSENYVEEGNSDTDEEVY